VFGSVVVVAFQIAFRAEIHANDVFSFLKNHFWHQHIKTIQKVQTALNFSKKKNFKIWWNAVTNTIPNGETSLKPYSTFSFLEEDRRWMKSRRQWPANAPSFCPYIYIYIYIYIYTIWNLSKIFLKNKKYILFWCISKQKVFWKATIIILLNTTVDKPKVIILISLNIMKIHVTFD
jgi:hypothetical protein